MEYYFNEDDLLSSIYRLLRRVNLKIDMYGAILETSVHE